MMNKNTIKTTIMAIAMLTGLFVKAQLPSLATGTPGDNLPATASASNEDVFVDVDGDGYADFEIRYVYSSWAFPNPEFDTRYRIIPLNGGRVLAEPYYFSTPASAQGNPVSLASPVVGPNRYFATILEKGTVIGATPVAGSEWRTSPIRIGRYDLTENSGFTETLMDTGDGYIGVVLNYQGSGSGNVVALQGNPLTNGGSSSYGWIHVRLDHHGEGVEVLSTSGNSGSGSSSAVAGLNDPFAVPIPLIASILGMGLIGIGAYLRKRKK